MNGMVLDGAMPRSRSKDPVTSLEAGRTADLKGSQAAVMQIIRLGKRGWTQFELEKNLPEFSPSRVRSAVSELVALGRVEAVEGKLRETPFGRQAQVYRAVASG